MKILVATDMEGISGVVASDHVTPGTPDYERFRKIMTADVNAAVRGAMQGGGDDIVVTDGHWDGRNILIEELDSRVRLISGLSSSPLAMVEGVQNVQVALFVGYHARMGTANAILDHTWSSSSVANVWLNGKLTGETGLNAAVCGHFDVPVVMVSGDQSVCAEANDWLHGPELAVVKKARGRNTAECLPLELAHQVIREAALRAISRFRADQANPPLKYTGPVQIAVEFMYTAMADRAVLFPGTQRIDGRKVQVTGEDMLAAYSAFRTLVGLASR